MSYSTSGHDHVDAVTIDESQLACPFCKLDPQKWLLHKKCSRYQDRGKLYDLWHLLETHAKYNEGVGEGHDDYVNPKLFKTLKEWFHLPGKVWKKPELLWREIYQIVADGMGIQMPDSMTPYWNETWLRACWPGRMNAIDTALTNRDLKSSARVILKEIEVRKEENDDKVNRIISIGRHLGNAESAVNNEIRDLRSRERHQLRRLKRQLLNMVESPRIAASLLQEIGTQLEEERGSGWVTVPQFDLPSQDTQLPLPTHHLPSQLPVTRTHFPNGSRWPSNRGETASSTFQRQQNDQVYVQHPHSPATISTEYSALSHGHPIGSARDTHLEQWQYYEASHDGSDIDQKMDLSIYNGATLDPYRGQQTPSSVSFGQNPMDAGGQYWNGRFYRPYYQ